MACPAPFNVAVTGEAPAIVNVTVPVGAPEAGATRATMAVNVTVWPVTAGFGEGVMPVVVAPLLTVCVVNALVDDVKLASPL